MIERAAIGPNGIRIDNSLSIRGSFISPEKSGNGESRRAGIRLTWTRPKNALVGEGRHVGLTPRRSSLHYAMNLLELQLTSFPNRTKADKSGHLDFICSAGATFSGRKSRTRRSIFF